MCIALLVRAHGSSLASLGDMANDRIAAAELRSFIRMAVFVAFEKIPTNKGPSTVRKITAEGLLRIMVQLMSVTVKCQPECVEVTCARDCLTGARLWNRSIRR